MGLKKQLGFLLFGLICIQTVHAQCDTIPIERIHPMMPLFHKVDRHDSDSVSLKVRLQAPQREWFHLLLNGVELAKTRINGDIDEGCYKYCCEEDFVVKIPKNSYLKDSIKLQFQFSWEGTCLVNELNLNIEESFIFIVKGFEKKEPTPPKPPSNDGTPIFKSQTIIEYDYNKPVIEEIYIYKPYPPTKE